MRKLAIYIIIVFQILLIASLIRGVYESFQARERIERLERTRSELEQERAELGEKLKEVQSAEYLERVAREELHLAKPGEKVVIVPEEARTEKGKSDTEDNQAELPNWQKWWGVVSGKMY
ncbi:TPA: hypothetical protein DD448_03880 [Candidatus Collierbacteria bacterium]|uniref:Cell division protein FtsL n=1 Tax=Candidatus Collierbacteria bacterium RIFOXYD1_FULL_46_26 TaxID=1817732 RepID=A0A1F5FX77_9BACT|nr:MAG: putative septum formation initiator [Microgenomates group bacterium GW2011_GWF1_46_12]KKU27158.1 MAG: putative septum formation initiator [Microgenomates group bacterium GW2011_GWF2_46_18]KKU44534.1 MAG: putative septum formation initiator [Microgenomates group bacterium GW2011_GWB1_46_7]OGD70087.1 MAG: hypothetical protein A2187_00050 [Candidatus Collierbacteria bacterium RIFOXYA1_FULL_46_24]OGD84164.1 MAG: hypothetical protein A2618_00735 [Candidatus Collierbacteria bacterium RIFOXYD1